eukprot:4507364-Pleurochrysis_carterae.AAC.1
MDEVDKRWIIAHNMWALRKVSREADAESVRSLKKKENHPERKAGSEKGETARTTDMNAA